MSVQALGGPVRAQRSKLRLEHFVMGGAVLCLIVLVVLPLFSLLLGSVKGEAGLSLEHFQEVMTGRLYLTALKNSLILGAWTGLFSLLIGVSLAWAVSRTNVPAKPLIQITASLSYLSPPFLTAIAYVYLYSPNAGLLNVLLRDVLGVPWLTFNVFSMTGLVLVTVLHTFPFVYLLASAALQSVDASYEEAAQILGLYRPTLYSKMKKHGIRDPGRSARGLSPGPGPGGAGARRRREGQDVPVES